MPPVQTSHPTKAIRFYTLTVFKKSDPLSCPQCKETVSSKEFERHCSTRHALNPRLCCVWCQGNTRWPSAHKWKHVDHLIACWRRFTILNSVDASLPSPLSTPGPKPLPKRFDMEPTHSKRCLFDHDFDTPPLGAYDPVWPADLEPPPLPFQDESLNLAASCVRKYLELGDEAEWFHVMVRAVAFPSFLEAMDSDEGRSRTLPFSCWCDGGLPAEPSHRQHRHMLVVSSPPGHFLRNVWKKTRVDRYLLPRQNFRCVLLEPIRDAMHLVNAIGYVSNRKSQCTFSRDYQKAPAKDNHFYLFETLPRDYRLPLVLQWEGGLLQLLDQEHKNTKRIELVCSPLEFVAHKWRFRIKNIPGIDLYTVLPVSSDFRPCPHQTPHSLHLVGSDKIYFERHPLLCDPDSETWLHNQADMGNLFHHIVGEQLWTPHPHHQGIIREFKPLVDRIRELEKENSLLREEAEDLKRKHAEELSRENKKTRHWKIKCHASEQEVKNLQNKRGELSDELLQLHKEEITRLKKEIEELKLSQSK